MASGAVYIGDFYAVLPRSRIKCCTLSLCPSACSSRASDFLETGNL